MRIDFVSIFPDYFAPLSLSLPGKAQAAGLVEVHAHDLRTWAHDRHNTVDDAPYGGGAGMVMKPEPWGEALDSLLTPESVLVVPTPSGRPFTQALAAELARESHLVFACGRYEGIDQRVFDAYAQTHRVVEVSLGDYVLNGGEVAALAITEAVVRLIPGFMGNPESLAEESHVDGLLEYPVYTKPQDWRGRQVPAVLRSGDHGAIEEWRAEQALRRTAERRPDLLPAAALARADGVTPAPAQPSDAAEILVLTRSCWIGEALTNEDYDLPHFAETVEDTRASLAVWDTWVIRVGGRLVASVRGRREGDDWEVGRLMVAPDLEGRGLGRLLLELIESRAPEDVTAFRLYTGAASARNQRLYKKAGYRVVGPGPYGRTVLMRKVRR